jgi:hypothetical protein
LSRSATHGARRPAPLPPEVRHALRSRFEARLAGRPRLDPRPRHPFLVVVSETRRASLEGRRRGRGSRLHLPAAHPGAGQRGTWPPAPDGSWSARRRPGRSTRRSCGAGTTKRSSTAAHRILSLASRTVSCLHDLSI